MEESFVEMRAIEFNESYNTSLYDNIQENSGFLVGTPVFWEIYKTLYHNNNGKHFYRNYDIFLWFNYYDLIYLKHDVFYASNFILNGLGHIPNYELNSSGYLYLGKTKFTSHLIVTDTIPPMHFHDQVAEKSKYEKQCQYEEEILFGPPEPLDIPLSDFLKISPPNFKDSVSLYDFYLPILYKSFLKHASYSSIKSALDLSVISYISNS